MGCKYIYDGEKYDSYQDAIDIAIIEGNAESDVIFYSGQVENEQEKQIIATIKKIEEESKKNKDAHAIVTQLVKEISEDTSNFNENPTIKSEFQREFGIKFHKCLELAVQIKLKTNNDVKELNEAKKDLVNYILNFKDTNELFKELSEEEKNAFINEISLLKYFNSETDITNVIDKTINKVIDENLMKNSIYPFPELHLKTNNLSAKFFEKFPDKKALKGVIDLLTLERINGKLTLLITDYKTKITQGGFAKERKETLQLELYKSLLESLGINLPIEYRVIEISFKDSKEDPIRVGEVMSDLKSVSSSIYQISGYFKKSIDIEKAIEIQKKSNDVLGELYSDKTLRRWSIDNFIESLVNRKTQLRSLSVKNKYVKSVSKDNNLVYFTDDTSMNLQQWAEKEIKEKEKLKQSTTAVLIRKLQSAQIRPDAIKNIVKNKNVIKNDSFYENLKKYTMGDWRYVSHPGLEENGIIVMQNFIDKTYDFITLSNTKDFEHSVKLQYGTNLLGDLISDGELIKLKKQVPESNAANILRMKTLALINLFAESFDSNIRIGEIKIIDPNTGYSAPTRNLNDIQQALKLAKELKAKNIVTSLKISFESDRIRLFKFISDFARKHNISIDKTLIGKSNTVQIEELNKILKQIEKDHPNEINPNRASNEIISEIDELHKWIGSLIAVLSGYDITEQYHTSTWGLKGGLLGPLFRTGQAKKFAQNGYVLTGLAQGMDMSVTYANPDAAVDAISRQHRIAMAKSRRDLEAQGLEINKATTEFLNKSVSVLSQAIIGYNKSAYMPLFQTKNGKIDNSLRLKRPDDKSLTDFQKDYLEILLWTFNKYRMPKNIIDPRDQTKTFAEIKNTETYKKYKAELEKNDKWLNYPLRKAKNASIIAAKFGSSRAIKQTWNDIIDNFQKLTDPRNMFSEQKKKQQELEESLTMFNQYSEVEEDRVELLEKRDPENFELNMNIVALDYIFSNIKEDYYNNAMSIDEKIIGYVRLMESLTGQDYSSTIQTINDRVKIDLYGKHLTDPDLEEVTKGVMVLRAVGSAIKIGGRPILFAKEMTSSILKIIAKSALGYFQNENLSSKEILAAMGKVFGTSLEHMGKKVTNQADLGDFSLIGSLNRNYGIANFDMNIVPEKFAADRFGLYNVTKQLLYTTSTAPDFYNRMTIFVACMIKDGCYDAHTMGPDGQVIYNMEFDDRFSEWWKHRNDKNYKSETFYQQRALYEWTARQFNSEGYDLKIGEPGPDGELIFDPLPMAYTNLQKDSIKESIGTILGMYDHEESETNRLKTFSIYFRQFQTYWAGEVKKYFAVVDKDTKTAKGRPELKRENGKIVYKAGYDEYGEVIETTDNKNGDLEPIYQWTGHPVEGLVISFLGTLHDVFSKDFREKLKNGNFEEKQRLANVRVLLFNLLIAYFIGALFAWMWGGGDEENIPEELVPAYDLMKDRVAQEFSPWQSIAQPILDLNIVGLNYAQDFAKDLSKVITRDDYSVLNVMYDNISAFKDTGYMDKE